MVSPFPKDPAARKAAAAEMHASAPELMADIAALRAAFPGARLTYIKTPTVEYGIEPRDGHPVSQEIQDKFERDLRMADAIKAAERAKEKKRITRSVSAMKRHA